MKVAIHQPNYLPWLGFFKKMAMADTFVILDTVQFSRDSFTQRTKIRTKDGWMWLTIPLEKEYHFRPIKDIRLPKDGKWIKKHKTSIVSNYSRSPYYDGAFMDGYYDGGHETLRELNESGIGYIKERMGIKTKIIRASDLDIDAGLASTDMLLEIVEKAGGDTYVSGQGGEKYMDKAKFDAHHIGLEILSFEPSPYTQRWDGFEPYMSAIDFIFNVGEGSS